MISSPPEEYSSGMESIFLFLLSFMFGINEIAKLRKIIGISADYAAIPIMMFARHGHKLDRRMLVGKTAREVKAR